MSVLCTNVNAVSCNWWIYDKSLGFSYVQMNSALISQTMFVVLLGFLFMVQLSAHVYDIHISHSLKPWNCVIIFNPFDVMKYNVLQFMRSYERCLSLPVCWQIFHINGSQCMCTLTNILVPVLRFWMIWKYNFHWKISTTKKFDCIRKQYFA